MTRPVPSSLDHFGEELGRAVRRELQSDTPRPSARTVLGRRPGMVTGGALGIAGVAATLVLALGGATAAPALAVTHESDGSVLVTVNLSETHAPWVKAANDKLAAMGIHEEIALDAWPVSQPAPTATGPITCAPVTGPSSPSGPPIKVEVTGQVPAGNAGAGATGIFGCGYMSTPTSGAGNTGTAS
jgi:hypothetical protein